MSAGPERLVRVIVDYQAPYPDPIRGKAGDEFVPDFSRKTDIPGWVWCTDRSGRGGWVPLAYLDVAGGTARLRCEYDAIELTIRAGETLTVRKEESGFYWVTARDGRQGWVPAANVEACNINP